MKLQQQEKDMLWEAGHTGFKHYFFGYMFAFVDSLSEEHQKDLLNAAEQYLMENNNAY